MAFLFWVKNTVSLSFRIFRHFVNVNQVENGREVGASLTPARILSNGREAVFDFGSEDSVDDKRFDNFNNFNRILDSGQSVKKTFVPDSIESRLYVEKHIGGSYVFVMVFFKLVANFSQYVITQLYILLVLFSFKRVVLLGRPILWSIFKSCA